MLRSRPPGGRRLEARTRMPSWAYMLLCADSSFYTGCTTDLDTRFGRHQAGTLVNDATKASFTYKDECVRLGPLVGHDPEATQAATVAVTGFLKSVLKP